MRFLILSLMFAIQAYANGPIQVDQVLVLAQDVSSSVEGGEFELQRQGVAAAFRDPQVQRHLTECNPRGIGLSVFDWAVGAANPGRAWKVLRTPKDADDFAFEFLSRMRGSLGGTDLSEALFYADSLFDKAPYSSEKKTLVISGDGPHSAGLYVYELSPRVIQIFKKALSRTIASRQGLLNQGVVIDAITMEDEHNVPFLKAYEVPSVLEYYRRYIVSPGAPVDGVQDYKDYGAALKSKLLRLLCPVVS